MKTTIAILFSVILTTTAAFGQVTILWNESVNGELSQDYSTATTLGTLQLGTNSIIGATEVERTGNNWFEQGDYFTFEVPSNSEITALYIGIDTPNVWTWIGDPTFYSHLAFSGGPSTGDLLPQWGLVSIDFGIYGMYLVNHDHSSSLSIANYQLDFVVELVPEPGTLGLLLLGAGVFTLRHCCKPR